MSDPNPNSNPDPSINPIFNPNPDPHKNKFKPDPEAIKKLNPKVFPELTRYQYKYTKSTQRRQLYILVEFTKIDDNNSRADWSLYVDDDMSDDKEPLVELTCSSKEFDDMIDRDREWERDDGELVIVK
jgi:hypothetical protein